MHEQTYTFGRMIVIGNADSLRTQLEEIFARPDLDTIIFDMRSVTECDSSGLRLLIDFNRQAANAGRRLVLRQPGRILRELLSLTRLQEIFTIED